MFEKFKKDIRMSSEKKVLLLFLLLIGFISFCVYSHLPKFMEEQNTSLDNSLTTSIKLDEEVKKEEVKLPEKKEEITENIEEKQRPENLQESKINTQDESPEELVSKGTYIEDKPEEVQEEIIQKPLITTGEKYKREGSEKNIEDLSIATQELQIKINEYIKENPIIFKRASYKITNASNKTINEIISILKENPNIKIEVAGHTDSAGESKVNQLISQARAQTVEKILIKAGIEKERIIARGYGEDIPLVKNSKNGYSKINRRVEFNIVEE